MTSTPRRTLADAVRRPAPAALIEGVPDRSPTSLAAAPALAPETFDPVRAIATLDDMRAVIDATTDPHELRDVAATTSALQGWLAHHKRSTALANAASATTLAAERRLGGVLAAMERAPGRRDGGPSEYQAALDALDLNRRIAERWAELATIPEHVFASYIGDAVAARMTSGQITGHGLKRFAEASQPSAAPAAARPSRPSAATLREAAAVALGGLDCDAADTPAESWRGRAWVAPKAADLHDWITACVQAWAEGRVSAAVLLVPVQPDADWWALLAGSPLCLLRQPEMDQRRLGGRDRTSGRRDRARRTRRRPRARLRGRGLDLPEQRLIRAGCVPAARRLHQA